MPAVSPIRIGYPASRGNIKTMPLVIPSKQRRRLTQATGYPASLIPTGDEIFRELVFWEVSNDTSEDVYLGGEDVDDTNGRLIPQPIGVDPPSSVNYLADPHKTYVYNDSTSAVTIIVLIVGKF